MAERTDMRDVLDFLTGRSDFYKFLASLYDSEPTPEFLERMAATPLALGSGADDESRGWRLLVWHLRRMSDLTASELASDYAHVFLGAGAHEIEKAAPPYESVFVSESGMLMQEPRDQVVAEYARERVSLVDEVSLPEDHLAFELQFMSIMMGRAHEAAFDGDAAEAARCLRVAQRFATAHLCAWVPAFAAAVLRHANTDFYRGVALLTRGFISTEPACLGAVVARIDPQAAPAAVSMGEAPVETRAQDRVSADGEASLEGAEGVLPLADVQVGLVEARERADDLFKRMRILRRVFVATLGHCLEARGTDELLAFIAERQRFSRSPYRGPEIVAMLADAGLLVDLSAESAESAYVGEGGADATLGLMVLPDGAAGPLALADLEEGETVLVSANQLRDDGAEPAWMTTEVGQEYAVDEDPLEQISKLLDLDAKYLSGYRDTLSMIRDGRGKFTQVEEMIKATDFYRVDNRHASAFLKRLEDAGAIEWRGHEWGITPAGERTLAKLAS